jgi:hypothetical protein
VPRGVVRVAICRMGVDLSPWELVIESALARPLAADDVSSVQIKRDVDCGPSLVETACTAGVLEGGGKGIACSPRTLLQLLRASAWYALKRREGEAYEAFRRRSPAPINVAAIHFADRSSPDAALEASLNSLPRSEDVVPKYQAGRIFVMTVNLVYAAVFGHEDGHLYERAPFCGRAAASHVESAGLYTVLGRVQSSGELFKPNDPSPAEFTADRCATRRIRESIERYAHLLPEAQQPDLLFSRRAAADIVAVALLLHEDSAHQRLDATPVEGYLYPPLRILALAGELDGEEKPRICGAAAETFVQTTQAAFRAFAGKGILPDELEAALPPGVPDAWNRKSGWSTQSFSCADLQ